MSFSVETPQGPDSYGANARYQIDGAGVLRVDDGDGNRIIYGPTGWVRLVGQTPKPFAP
jgi:hypothetical protein